MPTVVNRQKLRSICDLPPSPCVPAAKLPCARRLPEDRCQTTSRGAYEIPLLSPEVSGACDWGPHRRCRKLKTAKDPRPSNIRLQCSALRYSRPHSGLSGTPLLMPLYPWRWGRYSEAFKYLMIIFRLVIIEPSPAVLHLLATGKALATNRVLLCQTFPIIVSSPTVRCLESCSAPPVRYYPSRAASRRRCDGAREISEPTDRDCCSRARGRLTGYRVSHPGAEPLGAAWCSACLPKSAGRKRHYWNGVGYTRAR
jgi:hypothetical protein